MKGPPRIQTQDKKAKLQDFQDALPEPKLESIN
jgi:hypothetical protein